MLYAHGTVVKKALTIGVLILTGTVVSGYMGYFYVTPNVTVVNTSQQTVRSFVVTLPNSRLDFGGLEPGETNIIYYSLDQSDGQYLASVVISDSIKINKSCGYVTTNEIHKRVTISYTEGGGITCTST